MRFSAFACVVVLACSPAPRDARPDTVDANAALRDTLVGMGTQDQAGRDSIALAVARNDTAFMRRMMQGDSARTRWLQSFVATHGWPRRAAFGDSAVLVAWMIVQHSPDYAFQEQMLPLLEDASMAGEVKPAEIAMLSDRIAAHRGQPQRYGTQFSLHSDTLVADPIADLTALDSLRASVGLPPILEYTKVLQAVYKVPVQWPPKRRAPR